MCKSIYFENLIFSHALTVDIKNDKFTSHYHSEYEILYIIKGTGSFVVENTSYQFTDGTVFLIPPGKYHVLKYPPQSNYERMYIYLPEKYLPSSVHIPDVMSLKINDETSSLFFKFERYIDLYPRNAVFTLFLSFLSELLITLTYNKQDKTEQDDLPPIIKKAIEYISEHVTHPLTLTGIAKSIFVSPNHLSHKFSDTMHISIMNYVRIKKMFMAKNFLQNGYSPTKAAELVGYNDYPTFYKNYVATFKASPSSEHVKQSK